MLRDSNTQNIGLPRAQQARSRFSAGAVHCNLGLVTALLVSTMGCTTTETPPAQTSNPSSALTLPTSLLSGSTLRTESEKLMLHEGDSIRIAFPGATNLDTLQQIRRDGKVSLKLFGEFQAAGLSPGAMEKELLQLYGPQLVTKEVVVTLEGSTFPVYVTGAVLRPGKIISDRPLTVLEAVMEAGGFDSAKANLKAVNVVRQENGHSQHYTVNLKRALIEGDKQPFHLKPSDIIYVSERFQWF